MPIRRSKLIRKGLRDAGLGLAVYTGIAILALEDRAQAGSGIPDLPSLSANANALWGADPSILTLFVLGLLFALLTAFTLSVFRHFGQNFALSRIRTEHTPYWSALSDRAYRKKL